jgi:uncharacterized protein (TIGR02145 family)
MRYRNNLLLSFLTLVIIIITFGCKKDNVDALMIETLSVANITASTVTGGGSILNSGGVTVTSSGVCWSINKNPTVSDARTTDGSTIGKFFSSVTGLMPLTSYYLRSYVSSAKVTAYGGEVSFTTADSKAEVTDIDGNIYSAVTIGSQIWMKENLRVTRYSNGDLIGTTNPPTLDFNEVTPKYQWAYNGNESFAIRYGRLYTWFAATDSRNICPVGWHLPADSEWTVLTGYLMKNGYGFGGSGEQIAKSLAATTDWAASWETGSPGVDLSGNNSSGFEGLPAGFRQPAGIPFYGVGEWCMWWSATPGDNANAWPRELVNAQTTVLRDPWWNKSTGFSVRCVKDN